MCYTFVMEHICQNCFKRHDGRGKIFCSHNCRASFYNKVNNPIHKSGAREKMIASKKGKFTGEQNPNWRGGHSIYQKFRKAFCEICGTTTNQKTKKPLYVHHVNKNRMDGREENLKTVCASCHEQIHQRWL